MPAGSNAPADEPPAAPTWTPKLSSDTLLIVMPDVEANADEVIALYEQAAELQRTCPLRRGSTVRIGEADADEVLVSADLHGHRENFDAITALADLDGHPRRHLVLQEVCHGGPQYRDGGCMSHRLLESVARLVVRYPHRVHYLLSNHELAEVTDYPIMKARRMLNVVFRMGLVNAFGRDADRVRQAAVGFIRQSPLAIAIGGEVFVSHSLPERLDRGEPFDVGVFERALKPSDLVEDGAAFRVVWGRDFRPENAAAFADLVGARVLLHGHEPCAEGYRTPNDRQVILDCCCNGGYCALVPTKGPLDQAAVLKSLVRLDVSTS